MALSSEAKDFLRKLSLEEQREAAQLLYEELKQKTGNLLTPGATYEISSVYDSFEAAHQLQDYLEEYKRKHGQG